MKQTRSIAVWVVATWLATCSAIACSDAQDGASDAGTARGIATDGRSSRRRGTRLRVDAGKVDAVDGGTQADSPSLDAGVDAPVDGGPPSSWWR